MSPRAECGKKDVEGLYRCELKPGHRGEHQAEWEGSIVHWGRDKQTSRRIRQSSDKQDERTAFLHGIKAVRLEIQARSHGCYWCEGCTQTFMRLEDAWNALTVSHIDPRTKGARYDRTKEPDFGIDDPSNIVLECIACNQARTPNEPQWSKAAS